MSITQSYAAGEVHLAANTLLDEHGAVKTRELIGRKVAHFATFFGNVLPDNDMVPIMLKREVHPSDPTIPAIRPQLALPAVKTSAGRIALVESVVRVPFPRSPRSGSDYHHNIGLLTEIRIYLNGEPINYWDGDGIVLGTLKPEPSDNVDAPRRLATPAGPINNLKSLQNVITLTNAVLTGHGIAPYPGFSAQ